MILKAGIIWSNSNKTDGSARSFCISSSGRIIAAISNQGVWYSDNGGKTWTQSDKTDGTFDSLCVTDTNRILAGYSTNLYYSDDNGETWAQLTSLPANCETLCHDHNYLANQQTTHGLRKFHLISARNFSSNH